MSPFWDALDLGLWEDRRVRGSQNDPNGPDFFNFSLQFQKRGKFYKAYSGSTLWNGIQRKGLGFFEPKKAKVADNLPFDGPGYTFNQTPDCRTNRPVGRDQARTRTRILPFWCPEITIVGLGLGDGYH